LNILGNFESRQQEFNDKKALIDTIYEKFKLNRSFYLELLEEIRNEDIKDDGVMYNYISKLPLSLKNRLIKKIYNEILSTISFF
jgi:hypothetical protein